MKYFIRLSLVGFFIVMMNMISYGKETIQICDANNNYKIIYEENGSCIFTDGTSSLIELKETNNTYYLTLNTRIKTEISKEGLKMICDTIDSSLYEIVYESFELNNESGICYDKFVFIDSLKIKAINNKMSLTYVFSYS